MSNWTFPDEVLGWLSEQEGRALADFARGKDVLEFGAYCGRSTICMAQTAKLVTTIDPFDGRGTPVPRDTLDEFMANLQRYGVRDKVVAHVGTSALAGCWRNKFDRAFIDAAHDRESVLGDAKIAINALKPGGLLAFHDYARDCDPGVKEAVDELIADGCKLVAVHDFVAVVDPQGYRHKQSEDKPLVALAMARRGRQIADDGAAEGFYRFPARKAVIAALVKPQSTILPYSFNHAWAGVLNLRDTGIPIRYYAQIHDDITPAPWWVDTLIEELVAHDADVVSAVVPIKNERGLTSTAVYTGDLWLPRRLSMAEVMELPETFGAEHVEGPLLLNTGLWVADITKPWADEVCFDFMNRIRRTSTGERVAEFVPEDWLNSHRLNELGCKLMATRKVRVEHMGESDYPNDRDWGQWRTDEVYRQRTAARKDELQCQPCVSSS